MAMKTRMPVLLPAVGVLAAALAFALLVFFRAGDPAGPSAPVASPPDAMPRDSRTDSAAGTGTGDDSAAEPLPDTGTDAAEPEDEEERLAEAFDAETDRWMDEERTEPPTMKDVDAYRDKFRKLPDSRKEDCLRRALNLVPDANVMLLAGILMDKSVDKALVEIVYADFLNRAEEVKKPVLKAIFADKTHPCWADTAWILDVTGELPKGENGEKRGEDE